MVRDMVGGRVRVSTVASEYSFVDWLEFGTLVYSFSVFRLSALFSSIFTDILVSIIIIIMCKTSLQAFSCFKKFCLCLASLSGACQEDECTPCRSIPSVSPCRRRRSLSSHCLPHRAVSLVCSVYYSQRVVAFIAGRRGVCSFIHTQLLFTKYIIITRN